MCAPSLGRVPAGHGVSPSALLEAGSPGFYQHTIQASWHLSIQESLLSTCHAPLSAEITYATVSGFRKWFSGMPTWVVSLAW